MAPSVTSFTIATQAELNAAIAAINAGGTDSAASTSYVFLITSDLALSTAIPAINLLASDTLSIEGDNSDSDTLTAVIDGGDGDRGFVVNSGTVAFSNLELTAMTAPGGTGGVAGGGGAIFVGAGASVSTTNVTFTGDAASGGTPAGGAVFVAQGGGFEAIGGSIAGAGTEAGNGIFIQGNGSITLSGTTVTGVISDQTGSHLGTGAGAVSILGAVTLDAKNTYTGGTSINGTLSLAASGAAGSGAIAFATPTGSELIVGAGDKPANTIDGFVPNSGAGSLNSDLIDLQGIGLATSYTISAGNHLTLNGGATGPVTLNLDPTVNYRVDAFVLQPDGGTTAATSGTLLSVVQTKFLVGSEADLNAALAQIDIGGKSSATGLHYRITFTASLTLSSDLFAINLAAGNALAIQGARFTLDGAGKYRGFFDYAGALTLRNMTIQNAVASGGAGGSGADPGGGGAGLGGGLFVASGASATLANVNFVDDQAVGGGGALGGAGTGGGGGLGGAGGAGGSAHTFGLSGGGGGIGLGATGGSAGGGSGGAGIVIGAAGGASGTTGNVNGRTAVPGGINGGGGGGAGVLVSYGSGRDPHTGYFPGSSGNGGIGGGFGGGAGSSGGAEFGGGGSNSAGGWGGGGSGANAGGFGGGIGATGGAGGGIGAGGGVFVQQGGSLTILNGSLLGGGVAGGAGSGGGGAGAGLGSGLFVQGTGEVILEPPSGQTLAIADTIADQAGAGGAASLTVKGAGEVVLSATNSFTGGTTLKGGTLSLQAAGAAGTGTITFAYGTAATLIVGPGDIPGNIISGFLPGDVIDLQGIGTATTATPNANNILTVAGGTTPVQLNLDPAQNLAGETFTVASDLHGGTLLTATDVNGDAPPFIAGIGTLTGDDHTPLDPFAGVAVADLNPGQTETVTVTQSSPANGVLSNLSGGSYNPTTGVYRVSGSVATVTAALQGLVFTPTIHQVAPGQVEATQFSLSASDGQMTSITRTQTLDIAALNDPPVISGVGWDYGYWNVPLNPFAGATVSDPDAGAAESVSFTVSSYWLGFGDVNGLLSLSLPGFTLNHTGSGTYTLTGGTSPAQVTAAIDAIQFTPTPYSNASGATDTQISVTVSDGIAPPVSATANVQAGLPIFTGTAANQAAVDGKPMSPFSAVTITDSAGLTIEGMTIQLYDSASNFQTTTDANGTLSGVGLTKTGVGTYTLAPGTTAAVTAELDALVFAPAYGSASRTTDFYMTAWDGATTSGNTNTSIVAAPGTTYTLLTTGVDTVTAGSAKPIIVALSNTLSAGDNINGGGGTLVLSGGGAFNLAAPATLTNIPSITAQEGAGDTAQTVTLRAGLSAIVTVRSDTSGDPSPGITIIGAANNDIINLGNGRDMVTVGAGEVVNGGSGNDTFKLTAAASPTATVVGGLGSDTLVLTTAGVVSIGGVSGVEKIKLASGAANTLTLTDASFAGVSGDTITVYGGGTGNTLSEAGVSAADRAFLVGGAGADTLIAGRNATMTGGAGADVFEFTTAGSTATPDTNKVMDFVHGTDKLTFSDLGFDLGLAGATSTPKALGSALFSSQTNGTFDAGNTTERFAYNASTGQLIYGADGSASSSLRSIATLAGHPTVTAGDLYFVR